MTLPKPLSTFEIPFEIIEDKADHFVMHNEQSGSLIWPKKLLPNHYKKGDQVLLGPLQSNIIKTQLNELLFN